MNKRSITVKISIFFVFFVLLLIIVASGVLGANRMHMEREFIGRIHHNIELLKVEPKQDENIVLDNFHMVVLSAKKTSDIIKNRTPKIFPPPPPPNKHDIDSPPPHERFIGDFKIYNGLFNNIVVLTINGKEIGIKDSASNATFYLYFGAIFSIVLLAVSLLYAAILKSLRPLKELEKEIEAFGFGIKPKPKNDYRQNEIGRIQKAFHEASAKISGLLDAREIFLKNAAHELKTPIAKGVIVAHMIDESKQQKRLLDIFSSITQIIEGIMTAEEVMAKGFSPKIEPILLRSFCEKIRKKLLFEVGELFFEIDSSSIVMGDPRLLEIALSNLFENGVKFKSADTSAKCVFEGGRIYVKNCGERLEEPIDKYFEPFFKETSIRNEGGMGLGLYLTKKVLEIQGLKLKYEHNGTENIFTIG